MTRNVYRTEARRDAIAQWSRSLLADWRVPHELRVVHTHLGATTVVVSGGGSRRPVVVLPGANFGAAAVLPLAGRLARTRQVLVVDLPGQPGLSDPERPPNVGAYGAWIDEVLSNLEPGHVIVAHDLGAAVALLATPDGPSRIRALVLANPAGIATARTGIKAIAAYGAWLISPSVRTATDLARFLSAPTSEIDDRTIGWLAITGRLARRTTPPPALGPEVLARWRGHDVRVLLGRHDPLLSAERVSDALQAAGLDPARVVTVIDGAGHLLPDEQPDAIVKAIPD